MALDQQQDTTL